MAHTANWDKLLFCFQVGLQLGVIPREAGKVVVGFGIQYQYTNTVFTLGMYLINFSGTLQYI